MEEERLKQNIKTLSMLIAVASFLLLSCLFIDSLFINNKEELTQETTEDTTNFGEINESQEIEMSKYPKKLNSDNKNIIGTTTFNLLQSNEITGYYDLNKGLITSNDHYIAYSKYNEERDSFDLILRNKITNTEITVIKNKNPHFLHIYNNFIIGVFDQNYKRFFERDCIFLYNIEKDILTIYDKEIDSETIRTISSFVFDGDKFYFSSLINNSICSLDLDGSSISVLKQFKQEDLNDYCKIVNLQDNNLYINTLYKKYIFNLRKNTIKEYEINSILPKIEINNKQLKLIKENDLWQIYIGDKNIWSGMISAINIYDNKIYFAEGKKLYCYDNNVNLIKEFTNNIKQIYIDNSITIIMEGDIYEFYS